MKLKISNPPDQQDFHPTQVMRGKSPLRRLKEMYSINMHIYCSQARRSKLLSSVYFLPQVFSSSADVTSVKTTTQSMNSTVALQTNLNIILTHEFPFSSVKAELPLRYGNNKEKILLSVAPKNRLAEALVGSLLKTKGPCGSQGKQNLLSTT